MQNMLLHPIYWVCLGVVLYGVGCSTPPNVSELPCDEKTNCPTGQVCTDGICKALATPCNPFKPCTGGLMCVGGVCKKPDVVCDKGLSLCNQACVDTQTSMTNCGGCGKICPSVFVCSQGVCKQTCAVGETDCAGSCVDVRSDARHCGVCDKVCATGQVCNQGACVLQCQGGLQECSGQCVDIQANSGHCGACGKACQTGQLCSKGTCEVACDRGLSACGNICVDLRSNRSHCGACQQACAGTEKCAEGKCAPKCTVDLTDCGERCVDLDNDRSNCGACQKTCGTGEACLAGECKILCPAGQHICQGKCVFLLTDSLHCGACDQKCGTGAVCSNGGCVVSCLPGMTTCVQSCVDIQSDRRHCGACGVVCKPGEVCSQGKCELSCQVGLTDCGGNCVDLQTDRRHCGSCNKNCANGEVCSQGMCQLSCQQGLSLCVGKCVDTQTDVAHCGGCSKVCVAGEVCKSGACVLSCQQGLNDCSGKCVDQGTDRANCGACGVVCKAGEICAAGVCQLDCPVGLSKCNNTCVNAQTDLQHCGGCGKSCASGQVCSQGQCQLSCQSGLAECSGRCADLKSDIKHCGACGVACKAGEVCNAGKCEINCPGNQTNCSGECVNLKTDRLNCGSCGKTCAAGQICNNGLCDVSCSSGLTNCAGQCVSLQYDPNHCGGCGVVCTQAKYCGNGICRSACLPGLTDCSGTCANVQIDDKNCGTCGTICSGEDGCFSGQCKRYYQVAFGASHTCALLPNHMIKCWGGNSSGQLGYGDTTNRTTVNSNTIDLGNGRTARAISANENHTCAVLDNGSVKCWGINNLGQLGTGDTTNRTKPDARSVDLGTGRTAKQIETGVRHTCAILDNDTLKCWGYNDFGQLGYGDKILRNKPEINPINLGLGRTAKSIGADQHHVCTILDDGTVKCWGFNNNGQLGYGDTAIRTQPDTKIIDLGAGRTAQDLDQGDGHVCVVLDDNTVKCWGFNNKGQLGYGDTTNRYKPGSDLVDLGAGRIAKSVVHGSFHTCVLFDDGSVKCWGANESGQLGYGDTTQRNKPDGNIVNLGVGRSAKRLFAGYSSTCALLDDHSVKCWGVNGSGQLGYGDTTQRNKPDNNPVSWCPLGVCGCPSGQTDCSGTCRDLQADNQNCGVCGQVCPGGTSCTGGVCRIPLVQVQGAWRWSDGQMGERCTDYRQAATGYASSQTNGVYWLKVPGNSTMPVWCDQTQGGWALVGILNPAGWTTYDKLGTSAVSVSSLAQNPVSVASSSQGVTAWIDMNAAKTGFSDLRLTAIIGGNQAYTSSTIPISALRIPFGSNGYFLYNNPPGVYWCGGVRTYTDLGQNQQNRPAGAPANCKGHGSLASGFDFGASGPNAALTVCGSDGGSCRMLLLGSFYNSGVAIAFWMK